MANKPFLAVRTNIIDETNTTTTPGVIGRNSVLITQGQHKRILDTITTSVHGNPLANFNANFQQPQPMNPCLQRNDCYIQANAHFIPGGVIFTFSQNMPNSNGFTFQQQNNPFTQGLTLEQQIALKQLEKHGLEYLLLQEHMKQNPFAFDFHHNKITSTSDLLRGPSMGQPDFNAAAAFIVANNKLIQDYHMLSSNQHNNNARQLNLHQNHKDKQGPRPDAYISTCEEKNTMTDDDDSVKKEASSQTIGQKKQEEDKNNYSNQETDEVTTDTEDEDDNKNKKQQIDESDDDVDDE